MSTNIPTRTWVEGGPCPFCSRIYQQFSVFRDHAQQLHSHEIQDIYIPRKYFLRPSTSEEQMAAGARLTFRQQTLQASRRRRSLFPPQPPVPLTRRRNPWIASSSPVQPLLPSQPGC